MLLDKARTLAYKKVVEENASHLKDKVVIDVGCGTGILSMLCAKYGGSNKVYGIEASDMAEDAQQLVKENNLSSQVTVIKGKVGSVQLDEKADVILSEWMGTLLLFEFMIESVLVARDLYLSPGGVVWPSEASLYLVPCHAHKLYMESVTMWEDVYGLDFSSLKEKAKDEFLAKPFHNYVLSRNDCISEECCILTLDMCTVRTEDIENIHCDFDFVVLQDGPVHGFASWFKVGFKPLGQDTGHIELDTGPDSPLTHWKQDLLMLDEPVDVCTGDRLVGSVTLERNKLWRRHLTIHITAKHESVCDGDVIQEIDKYFPLWR